MDLRQQRTEFYQVPLICTGIMIGAHVLPKGKPSDPASYGNVFLLALTVSYFGAALVLLYHFTEPRQRFTRQWYAWSLQDGGPPIQRAAESFQYALSSALHPLLWILMAFVLSSAIGVFQSWTLLAPVHSLGAFAAWGWTLSFAGLLLYPFLGGARIVEAHQRWRALREQLALDEIKPRTAADLDKDVQKKAEPAVVRLADYAFRAGQCDWSWSDLYASCVVFGQTGSGKTICVLNALLDGLFASTRGLAELPAGLVLDPKGDFHEKIHGLVRDYGRSKDLLVLDPKDSAQSIRWNPLDCDDDELELAARFATVLESTGMKPGQESYWIDSAKKFLRHAIALLRATNAADEPPCLAQVHELATSFDAIAARTQRLDGGAGAADQALAFFADEWTSLAPETRSSVQSYLTNMLDAFLMEPYRSTFSGRSTVRVADVVDRGGLLYVHMPIADKEAMSRVVCTFVKLEFQREVLRRPKKTRRSFLFCDEFQSFFTIQQGKGDADFFERSRQSKHANIIATQNLPALLKVSPQDKNPVMNLLGNCAVKVFLRNTDDETNQFASKLFGQKIVTLGAASFGGAGGGGGLIGSVRPAAGGYGGSAQYDACVRPEEFTRLAIPSETAGVGHADAIVHLASRADVERKKLRWLVHPLGRGPAPDAAAPAAAAVPRISA